MTVSKGNFRAICLCRPYYTPTLDLILGKCLIIGVFPLHHSSDGAKGFYKPLLKVLLHQWVCDLECSLSLENACRARCACCSRAVHKHPPWRHGHSCYPTVSACRGDGSNALRELSVVGKVPLYVSFQLKVNGTPVLEVQNVCSSRSTGPYCTPHSALGINQYHDLLAKVLPTEKMMRMMSCVVVHFVHSGGYRFRGCPHST